MRLIIKLLPILAMLFWVIFMGWWMISAVGELNEDIKTFLAEDATNEQAYTPWHTCGHFSRELAANASKHNIELGSVILGYHPVFRGNQNHVMNYYVQNGSIVLIEPQTDEIMSLNDTMYQYYRLYPLGAQVPT